MTQEQRIEALENEIVNLKEELKKTKKANIWKEVKKKFKSEFNSFDWTYIDVYGDGKFTREKIINEYDNISRAIGTIVRIILKRRGLNYLEEKDIEKAERITKQILEIMKREEENK